MPNVKKEMLNGVFWSAVEKYSGLIVSIIVSMVMARLLSPSEYGVVAIATVIIHFIQMFCTMGIGPAVIQRKDLSNEDLNVIFTFSLIIGCVLSIILFFSSWPLSLFYGNSLLIPVFQILSIQVFFSAANMVPNALMSKNKQFKDIARRTLTLQILSGGIGIYAAWNGAGVFALLVSPVLSAVGIFFWNRYYYKVKIARNFYIEPLKRIFSYSIYQFLFEFFNFFSRNMDKLIIGKYMDSSALAYYEKSYRLMQMPLQNVTAVVNPVIQPIFSSFQDDMLEISRKYNKIISFIASISFPISVTLYFCGEESILVMYGSQWSSAIPVFKILALSIPTQMILSTSGGIWQSANATKLMFWTGMCNTCITLCGFMIGAFVYKTIEAVAWGWTLSSVINFCNTYVVMYVVKFKSSLWGMMRQLLLPFVNAAIIVLFLRGLMNHFALDNIYASLVIKVICALVVTIPFLRISQRKIMGKK